MKKGGSEMLKNGEDLFGGVKKVKATSDHVPDIEKLQRPFEKKHSVAYLFCKGCGLIFEVDQKQVDELAKKANLDIVPQDFFEHYFETMGCGTCAIGVENVSIKPIKK